MTDETNEGARPDPAPEEHKGEEQLKGELEACEGRLREVVELAARTRHEINNPLTGLIGQAQLLLRDESLTDAARRRVETIEQLAKRIRDIVAELRAVQHAPTTKVAAPAAESDTQKASSSNDPPRH